MMEPVSIRCRVETSDHQPCNRFASMVVAIALNPEPSAADVGRGYEGSFLVPCCEDHGRVIMVQRHHRLTGLPDGIARYVSDGLFRFGGDQ